MMYIDSNFYLPDSSDTTLIHNPCYPNDRYKVMFKDVVLGYVNENNNEVFSNKKEAIKLCNERNNQLFAGEKICNEYWAVIDIWTMDY